MTIINEKDRSARVSRPNLALRSKSRRDWRRSPKSYIFIAPAVVIFSIFLAFPLARNVYVSFYDWNGFTSVTKFVGLANYKWIFTNPIALDAAKHALIFGVLTISLQAIGGFLLAVSLSGAGTFRKALRTFFFIPVVLTPVVVGFLFSKIFEPNNGDLRHALEAIGLGRLNHTWLADTRTALVVVALVNVWLWTGFAMMIYQSALTTIPQELLESARIDGANSPQMIWLILVPMLRTTHLAIMTLSIIGTLKTFDIVYVLTKGGPGGATELPTTLLFRVGFDEYRQGAAAALGTVLFVVALVATAVQLRIGKKVGEDI